jgi:23S rRNA pseudouridine1911/1915/1917 synthase
VSDDFHTLDFTIEEKDLGERLDRVIAQTVSDLSRSVVQRLIKKAQVTVNGRLSKPSYCVEPGDRIVIHVPKDKPLETLPESIPLDIIYEDDDLLVVNKPAGMVVHPAYGHRSGTLVNAVLAHCPKTENVGGADRAGIVHRLDKDTSGVILVAKSQETHTALQHQFKKRQVDKTYLALVEGHPEPRQGIIDAPIGRNKRHRKQMAIVRSGRQAQTAYHVVKLFENNSLVKVKPKTGRTHQIRVHMAWLGYPVVGDRVYGYRKQPLLKSRHFLHAHELKLTHPVSEAPLSFTAPLPKELDDLLRRLRRGR